jgi:putative addiction module killer protein
MQKIKEVKFFVDKNQRNHVIDWLNKLDVKTRTRINLRFVRLEYGSYGDYKSLGNKLYELRFFFANGYRVYFTEQNNKIIIILCAGNKDTQKKDIKLAKILLEELKTKVQHAKT